MLNEPENVFDWLEWVELNGGPVARAGRR
jgi:hypothetical protein